MLTFMALMVQPALAQSSWTTLALGIEYQSLKHSATPWSVIHLFKIDPHLNEFRLVRAQDKHMKQAFVKDLFHENAYLAVNGGFFDVLYRPLGLRVTEHQTLNALKPISWWGVFYIENDSAHVSKMSEFKSNSRIQFALQSGPRLIIHGHIPPLKQGRDERTALGINAQGDILLVVTENAPLTMLDLAHLMQRPPLNALDAINLDGGSSTQLYTSFSNLNLDVHGFSMVTDAIIVQKK